ncbi:MAG TPA: PilZ domain-containing protein [Methylomirabilota bacterium]|nr:PilZ domain-containing protein [Methylomirabilota bacterium]
MSLRERRTFRLSCNAPVLVKYSQESEQPAWGYSAGVAGDVSMEGASVVLPESLRPGSAIELAFLPTSDEAPARREIKKSATVVWVSQLAPLPSAPFRHGLRFTEPEVDLLFWAWPGERLPD